MTTAPPSTAREALAAWLDYLVNERRASPRTVRAYGDAVLAYLGFLEPHRGETLTLAAMSDISAGDVRAYLAHRRSGDHPLAPRSVSQALSAIRAYHRWLDRRLGTPNAALGLVRGPKLPRGLPRPVSEDQARALIDDAGASDREDWEIARDEAVLTLLWGCGLRISEALSLTRADAPLGETIRITGKGGKTRLVPVLPAVREAIDVYLAELPFALAPDEPLFRAVRGGAYSPRHAPCPASLLRHPSAGRRRRFALDPGAAGSRVALDHPALHRRRRRRPAGGLRQGPPARLTRLGGRQGLNRLSHAFEDVVGAELLSDAKAVERLLGADRLQPGDGEIDASLAGASDDASQDR